ncbi:MAG: radical SAM protein [Methanocellales archaeon]|nr:radical SAM protein [Methanocellales archaeon]MDD3291954.1 radical SAM protein [Methanocellales archaeon]MDD5235645.1 radical SAM protein [Methanocellales archaeon]MDD5485492.1 radical SAM protein [Methanocellales archaeon]
MNMKIRNFAPLTVMKALWQLWVKKGPLILSHGINSECNLRCQFCIYWREKGEEMGKKEIFRLLDEARSMGVLIYNVWTAEPLMRKDLPECLEYAKSLGMMTFMVTNGVLLKERVDELSNLDYLSVSVDGTKSYEKLRGVDLDRVLDGINAARKKGIPTVINCVLNGKNLDEIEALIRIVEDLGIWISFEPLHEYEDISQDVWDELGLSDLDKYRKTVDRIIELKREGSLVLNSYTYLRMMRDFDPDFRCHVNDIILHVASNGEVENCRVYRQNMGEGGLGKAWESSKETRKKMSEECNGCLFFGYAELSLLYSLKLEVMLNCARIFRKFIRS